MAYLQKCMVGIEWHGLACDLPHFCPTADQDAEPALGSIMPRDERGCTTPLSLKSWPDEHIENLLRMRRLFSDIEFLVGASLLIVLASAAASFWSNQWHWFGRSGAVLTIAGLLLTFRPLVRLGLTEWLQSQSLIDCGHLVPTEEEAKAARQAATDGRASKLGVTIAIVGTLVWAYGDLIGGLPH